MCDVIFLENGTFLFESSGQGLINLGVSQRSTPSAAGENGEGLAARKMADTEKDYFLGQLDAGKDSSGDVAGKHVTGVGDETSPDALGREARSRKGVFTDEGG